MLVLKFEKYLATSESTEIDGMNQRRAFNVRGYNSLGFADVAKADHN